MPNIKSAKKRVEISKAENLRNKMVKNDLRTAINKLNKCITAGDKDAAAAAYIEVQKKIDMAVSKGVYHKNNGAHKKSELAAKLNAMA